MEWKLPEAKNRFSEVVRRAHQEGPQRIRRRNDSVIVLSERDYQKLKSSNSDFKAFLVDGPSLDGLDLTRDRTPMREDSTRKADA